MSATKQLLTGLLAAGALALVASPAAAADLLECAHGPTIYGDPYEVTHVDAAWPPEAEWYFERAWDDGTQLITDFDDIFPDGLKFQEDTYTDLWLNINGNITFANANFEYTPQAVPGLPFPAIVPFFGDIDLSSTATDGSTTANPTIFTCRDTQNSRLIFTWYEVGYFYQQTDKLNSFQLVLTNTRDECSAQSVTSVYDVEFRYKKLEWHTGEASSARPATAGLDDGAGNAEGLPGSGTTAVLDLVNQSNTGDPGVFRFRVVDGTLPTCGDGVTDLCEECDLGSDNGPNSACTPVCMEAACGDGFLHEGVEECDGDLFDPDFQVCPEGYRGSPSCTSSCTVDTSSCELIDVCAETPNACPNGTCVNDNQGGYDCECDSGYQLDSSGQCVNIDECADGTHTCDENATCTDTPGSFTCECDEGYEGDGHTCTDIDECADPSLNRCDANAICTNTPGGYECECEEGYIGDGYACGDRECTEEEEAACGETGSCAVNDNVVSCTCGDGFELDDTGACVDIDECADGTHTCDENATCTNTEGSYECECEDGFEGNGHACTDIDECADPELNDCDANATCTNTPGGFECECNDGYTGDGTVCTERECTEEEEAACGETGTCTIGEDGAECACGDGFELDESGACVDIDECADPELNLCAINATCINTEGGYNCECLDGFDGNGINCVKSADDTTGLIAGGGLASCSSTPANPMSSPLALLAVVMGSFAALRRRRRG